MVFVGDTEVALVWVVLGVMFGAHFLFQLCLSGSGLSSGKTEFKGKQLTTKSLMGSYLIVSTLANAYSAYLGVVGFGLHGDAGDVDAAKADLIYGYSGTAFTLASVQTGYQVYNFVMCCVIEEFRTPIHLGHHAAVAILCYQTSTYNFLHYFCLYFAGIAELSSVPLGVIDGAKYLPEFGAAFPSFISGCKYAFAVLFLIVRVIVWPVMSYQFLSVGIPLALGSNTDGRTLHSNVALWTYILGQIFLTPLQFYWFSLILKMATKQLKSQ